MRVALVWLTAGIIALGLLLVGCSGDDEQDQQPAPQAQQTEQASEPAASAQQDAQQSQPSQQSQPTQEQSESDDPGGEARDVDPLLEAALAASAEWAAQVTSFEMDVESSFSIGGLDTDFSMQLAVQTEPFLMLASIDFSAFAELGVALGAGLGVDQSSGEPLILQMLVSEDAAFLTMPGLGGWVDLSGDLDGALQSLSGLLGADPADLASPEAQFEQAAVCVEAVGGSVVETELDGKPVWRIECDVDIDELSQAAAEQLTESGFEVTDAGIESMRIVMAISKDNGAPVLLETHATLTDLFGVGAADDEQDDAPQSFVSSSLTLIAYNQPLEFPTPEPLVDGSLLGVGAATYTASSTAPAQPDEPLDRDELLAFAAAWLDTLPELELVIDTELFIESEQRTAQRRVMLSREQSAFETIVSIDDAGSFGLLWNRDGIWASEEDESGELIWEASSPTALGFPAGLTIDEFLATPNRFAALEQIRPLLERAWVERTILGDNPPVYKLGIEVNGPLVAGDLHFEEVVAIIKEEAAELISVDATIESVDLFITELTIDGDSGAVTKQHTSAAFQSSIGYVAMSIATTVRGEAPVSFSNPE